MKALDRLPGCSKLPRQIKFCEFCSVLEGIPCHDDSLFRKQVRARIPHHANHLLWERDPSIDAVILLPKSAGFPGHLVGGIITCGRDGFLELPAKIRIDGLLDRQWHPADTT